jgi:hypothetical protein
VLHCTQAHEPVVCQDSIDAPLDPRSEEAHRLLAATLHVNDELGLPLAPVFGAQLSAAAPAEHGFEI